MKLVTANVRTVAVELDATDCLALADACHRAVRDDLPGNREHLAALATALDALAIVAAFDMLEDNMRACADRDFDFIADTRRVWGPRDSYRGDRVAARTA